MGPPPTRRMCRVRRSYDCNHGIMTMIMEQAQTKRETVVITKNGARNFCTVCTGNQEVGIRRWLLTLSNSLRWRVAVCILLCLGVSCSNKRHTVTLTWQAPAPSPGVIVVGYNLYRSTTSGGPFVKLASNLTSLRYEDGLVGGGRAYFYVVTSIDQAGHESRYSNEARAPIP